MNKPLTIARQEFIDDLVNLINGSGLPAFVMSDVLSDILSDVRMEEQRQLARDKEEYANESHEQEDI